MHAAVFGIPWDGGASFRGGARFGPEGVRSASAMIRTYNPVQKVQVFGALSTIDYGDAPTAAGLHRADARARRGLRAPDRRVGGAPGGDRAATTRSTLAELRALAAVHGPLGLVHLDSHMDLWDTYFDGLRYSHGTMFRRALEEGILDPSRVLQAGMRGSLYGEADEEIPGALGVETIPWIELAELTARGARRSALASGSAPVRRSCRSTSTSSTRRSVRARERRRSAGRRASRP